MANNTNANSNGQQQVPVNGSTSGWDPDARDKIIQALLQNGGTNRIQSTIRQRLDESGWSQDLREYCKQLLRSGAATTYDDLQKMIYDRINSGEADPNGNDNGVPAPKLSIPDEAKSAGADAVRKELAQVAKTKK
jgi:hypothetical protein